MITSTEIECKKICVLRCIHVLFISCAIQFLLLAVFLLFVNFSAFHPFTWLSSTLGLFFSFYTWIYALPLISIVISYVILSSNSYLAVNNYHPTRFSWLCAVGPKKIAFIVICIALGFLTSWLYSRYLSDEYNTFIFNCFDGYCLNSRYMFITWGGIYSGLYYFCKEKLTTDPDIKFPVINEKRYVQVRSALYKILYTCLIKSFVPTVFYSVIYWMFGGYVNLYIANLFGANDDRILVSANSFPLNAKLFFYVWILSSQILSNLYILDGLFSVLLTQPSKFPIEKDPLSHSAEVTLVEGLASFKVPIIQQLASLDLYNLTNMQNVAKRQQLFTLSFPGGHPYNWKQLCIQCLNLIDSYTEELSDSVKSISTVKCNEFYKPLKPTATETAEKILLRQYNETYGIRRMMQAGNCQSQIEQKSSSVTEIFSEINKNWAEIKKATFKSLPGLFYLFGEPDGAKTAYMLSKSQNIVWITQGLAGLCAASLVEDKYGVVQNELTKIIKSLLKLKMELDKLNNVNLNGKKVDRNFLALKNSIKRSLYKICTVFSDYIRDLMNDSDEFKILENFIFYQDN
ncbi:nucleoporin Ndc1 [Condylostylus longicornis]|uniref:nucleoporin Ndc1 n=1 Tax=Condylostylus longicornis TaxID=2530218 RepID=UPI00244E057C|nr:nucleoporin Ndc1 [Condylostylus longicornis]